MIQDDKVIISCLSESQSAPLFNLPVEKTLLFLRREGGRSEPGVNDSFRHNYPHCSDVCEHMSRKKCVSEHVLMPCHVTVPFSLLEMFCLLGIFLKRRSKQSEMCFGCF